VTGPADFPPGYGGSFSQEYEIYAPRLSYGQAQAEPVEDPALGLHCVEAEAALLGTLLFANNAIPMVADRVREDDFFEPAHGRIFKTILKLHERGRQANPVTLRPIFQNDPDLKELGGASYLAQLTGGSHAGVIGVVDFADQIAELAIRRKVVVAAREAVDVLSNPDADDGIAAIDDAVSQIQDVAYTAMQRAAPMRSRSSAATVAQVRADLGSEEESAERPELPKCKTIPDFDKILGGLEPGVHVIGGRPGMCKTTIACSLAWGYAAAGLPFEYFHSEMTEDQMGRRHISDLSHAMKLMIEHSKLRSWKLSPSVFRALELIEQMAETLPINFVATGACDIRRVESAAARAAMRWKNQGRKLGGIVVDYMQKYTAHDARGRVITDATENVNAVSTTLARIAERLEIPVIALAQLGRQVEERKDKRPQINDLKLSGRIEEDADSVTLLFREEFYHEKTRPAKDPQSKEYQDWDIHMNCIRGKIEMIGEKNRHGRPRTRTVKFYHPFFAVRGSDFSEVDDPLLSAGLFDREEEEPGWR
jgi:replicative DNA helicase